MPALLSLHQRRAQQAICTTLPLIYSQLARASRLPASPPEHHASQRSHLLTIVCQQAHCKAMQVHCLTCSALSASRLPASTTTSRVKLGADLTTFITSCWAASSSVSPYCNTWMKQGCLRAGHALDRQKALIEDCHDKCRHPHPVILQHRADVLWVAQGIASAKVEKGSLWSQLQGSVSCWAAKFLCQTKCNSS